MSTLVEPSLRNIRHDLPIIFLAGPPGSGRSTLLNEVEVHCSGRSPVARLDHLCEAPQWSRIRVALSDLMLSYHEQVGGRRLHFPRVLLGLAAADASVETIDDPVQRQAALVNQFLDRNGTVQRLQRGVAAAKALLEQVDEVPPEIQEAINSLVTTVDLAAVTSRATFRWRPVARWYRDTIGTTNVLDALSLLNSWERGTSTRPPDKQRVDDILTRAFLSDLAAGYYGSPSANTRDRNCLLLLNSADVGPARTFVSAIVQARNAAPRRSAPDPLLIIGSVQTRYTTADKDDRPIDVPTPSAGYDDWRGSRDAFPIAATDGRPWAYSVIMPALSGAEEFTELVGTGHRPDSRGINVAEDVAMGHPRLSRALLQHGLSDDLTSTGPSAAVEAMISASLPASEDNRLRDQLVTVSALRSVDALSCRYALGIEELPAELADFLGDNLWVVEDRNDQLLHPALRRLLLHSLASRPAEHLNSWCAVHRRIAESVSGAMRAYHLLACFGGPRYGERSVPDLEEALNHIEDWYDRLEMLHWVNDLILVASAPRATPASTPRDDYDAVLSAIPTHRRTPIALLLVAKWLGSDLLRDPNRRLQGEVAHGYSRLATALQVGGEERSLMRHLAREAEQLERGL